MPQIPLLFILLFPLFGALLNGALALHAAYYRQNPWIKTVSLIGVLFPILSFLGVLQNAWPYLFGSLSSATTEHVWTWIDVGHLKVDFELYFDRLSALMCLIVTGIGSLIHLYSIGYMKEDKGFDRYFAYLNLFLFAMLTLVLANNLLVLFIGWEGVGLCSYLLIGFWFEDSQKASAGKKAFIVNRIGDFGFLIAIFILIHTLSQNGPASYFGVLNFEVIEAHKNLLAPVATLLTLFFFLAAAGKSAQIPLYVWLPDAMAGPTPVSALIHAATMVTAGVYLFARLHFLLDLAPFTQHLIAIVGAITAFFAASIGLVQRDIKKVLAYSTVSQLGYMFLAIGVGAPIAAIFHVMTHAFFKACLFLGSGSVIHAMHGEQDIFKMGGLKKWMPITSITFLISTLAIAGIPPLSGFFSKDEILWKTFSTGNTALWIVGLIAAAMTAFYMMRLFTLTFLGKCRADHHTQEHLHESPFNMTLPLVVLAGLAIVGGWVGIPHAFGGHNLIHEYLSPAIEKISQTAHQVSEGSHENQELMLGIASAIWAGFWAFLAFWLYSRKLEWMNRLSIRFPLVHQLLANKYYVDEIYNFLIVRPIHFLSRKILWKGTDTGLIDGVLVNGSAQASRSIGQFLGLLQSGLTNHYGLYLLLGLVGLVLWIV